MKSLAMLLVLCLAACLPDDPSTDDEMLFHEDASPESEAGPEPTDGSYDKDVLDDGPPEASAVWDGVNPKTSTCWNDRRVVESTHLLMNGNGQEMSTIIYLYYSPSCRTTWARLTGGTVARPSDSMGGSAKITRNSDGRVYSCKVTTSSGECTTAMVNDAGVTSYAYGLEDNGTWWGWARTANF